MKRKRILCMILTLAAVMALLCVPALAAGGSGDVATVVESTWKEAAAQLKTIVNNVVFPALDMILAIFFFVKLGSAYFDYRKHGQFEWAGPAILLACLIFTLTVKSFLVYKNSS